MAQVDIQINGREYKVACADGQESRLENLARHLDNHVAELVADLGQIGDARLMLLAALTVCDELFEARGRLADAEAATGASDSDPARLIEQAKARIERMRENLNDAG